MGVGFGKAPGRAPHVSRRRQTSPSISPMGRSLAHVTTLICFRQHATLHTTKNVASHFHWSLAIAHLLNLTEFSPQRPNYFHFSQTGSARHQVKNAHEEQLFLKNSKVCFIGPNILCQREFRCDRIKHQPTISIPLDTPTALSVRDCCAIDISRGTPPP
jgi:hypothetical protein